LGVFKEVSSLISNKVQAGEPIKPWLILGPFYKNYSDRVKALTFFERSDSLAGRDVINEIVEEAKEVLCSSPYEGQEVNFLDMTEQWNLVRRPEKYLSWGRYNFSNHLGAAFLTTIVTPECHGCKKFKLLTNTKALVAINGNLVFDTDTQMAKIKDNLFEYYFEPELQAGENILTIALFRLGRGATVGFLLECLNEDIKVQIPLAEGLSSEMRIRVEDEVRGLQLERDIFYPKDDINLLLQRALTSGTRVRVLLSSLEGNILKELELTDKSNKKITICSARELPDGEYQLACVWETKEGQPITRVTFDIAKITPTPSLVGYEYLEKRRHMALEHFADNPKFLYNELWNPVAGYILGRYEKIWAQVARYALGRYEDIEEEVIYDTCKFIAERKDCSEFLMQAILRLMCWEQKDPKLSREIKSLMKDTILGFKYWVDEPGDTVMHMSSENHRILLHTAEWLAGLLFPTEEFTNSHQQGLFHALKGRLYINEWLRQRGRFGFDEWHSNCYYPINIAALTNIYDFAPPEEYKLRQMAKQILDYMFFILAEDTFHGVFGTTHGRSYGPYIKYPDFEYTSSICWLLYGEGSLWGGSGMGIVSLATSKYKLPKIFTDVAIDYSTTIESYQRQGLFMDGEISANFVVYRTPDYMLSSVQDYCKGEYSPQTHVAQVTLENKAIIFWSCPSTSGEGPGLRPDYWSGNVSLPRAIQYRNVLALVWKEHWLSWMTHCFFELVKFDEVRFEGNWVFARVKDGYVGIYSQHGISIGQNGQYAGRELICYAPSNIWIVECGRKADWGSFDRFVGALKSAQIKEEGENLVYISPSIGEFVVGWSNIPTVNGIPVTLKDYPLISSKWAQSEYGSGHITLQYGDEKIELWFD